MTNGKHAFALLSSALFLLAVGACNREGSGGRHRDGTNHGHARESHPGTRHDDQKHAASSGHRANDSAAEPNSATSSTSSSPPSPFEKMQSMDDRRPVPLLPMMANHQKANMRDHLVAVRKIIAGVATEDFDAIRKAAEPIGSSPQMKQMCRHMGAGAEGFTERALTFHRKADGIIEAAKKEDMPGVMESLSATLETCTSCHARYKQQVVTPSVWEKKTGMPAPSPGERSHH